MSRQIRIVSKVSLALLALAMLAAPAAAQRVEKLVPDPRLERHKIDPPVTGAGPSPVEGRWVARVQLVYDKIEANLKRRSFEAWAGPAEAGLIFQWIPDDPKRAAAGRIAGKGWLIWRRAGTAAFDASAIVSSYHGEMRNGRRHGQGTLRTRSGFIYEGDWTHGLMDGSGRVALPNGDHYAGRFAEGRLHGEGRYIDATGEIYEGHFRNGVRQGPGLVSSPHAGVYRAVWLGGREDPATREQISPPIELAQNSGDYKVAVTVDTRVAYNPSGIRDAQTNSSLYRSSASGRTLEIRLDGPRIEEVWRGTGPIGLTLQEEFDRLQGGFLGIEEENIQPLALILEFENQARRPVRIVRSWLEISESRTDREPKLQVSRGVHDSCALGPEELRPTFDPSVFIENFGWGPAEQPELTVEFLDESGTAVTGPTLVRLPKIQTTIKADISEVLDRFEVDLEQARRGFTCGSGNSQTPMDVCLQRVRATGVFGRLGSAVFTEFDRAIVKFRGELRHSWVDAKGLQKSRTTRFQSDLSLGKFYRLSQAECGESGDPEIPTIEPFKFQLDRENYRIRMPIRDKVPAGINTRWRIRVEADKSSQHLFQVAFELSDGTLVKSRPIDLIYFRPRF